MKNILIFGSLPSGRGGMEKVFRQFSSLFNAIDEFHVQFFMYELNIGDNNIEWTEGLNIKIYKPSSKFRILQKRQAVKQCFKFISEYKPDVILVSDPLSILLAHKAIAHIERSIPIYSWIHFSVKEYKQKYRQYISLADKHLVLCDEMKQQFLELKLGNNENTFVIYNPITPKDISIPKPTDGKYKFLYVGRIQHDGQKNMQELFTALGQFPHSFTLDIVGDGDYTDKQKLEDLAKLLNIDKQIAWHGWQQDPWGYVINNIQSVTALVMTSKYEGFPMILCEAISYGIFCVSSDCPTGPKDIINKDNGFLYNINDLTLLQNHLILSNRNLSSNSEIKLTINHFYDKSYYQRLNAIFQKGIL